MTLEEIVFWAFIIILLGVLMFIFWMLVDAIKDGQWGWAVLIFFVPFIGAVLYDIFERRR